jgi:plastocyanin
VTRALLALAVLTVGAASFVCSSEAATLSGRVTLDAKPLGDAVVALRGGATPPSAPPPRVVMDQKHLSFHPSVLPVVRGTIVEFTNNDDVEHNVFSPSEVAGPFDLGTYSHGQSREVRFDRTGEVHVLCNIHMEMEAHILVLDEPYFAITRMDGEYEIRDLAPGEYELSLWSDGWVPIKQKVTISADDVRLEISAPRSGEKSGW